MSTTREMAQIMRRVGKCLNSDGHICVLLDFIPVEERLPELGCAVLILPPPPLSNFPVHIAMIDAAGEWRTWSTNGIWRLAVETGMKVTHWAEIPQVSDAR